MKELTRKQHAFMREYLLGTCGGRWAMNGANGAAQVASNQKTGTAGAENIAQIRRQYPHTITGGLCSGLY